MKNRLTPTSLTLALLATGLVSTVALADNLSDTTVYLCAPMQVTACEVDGECLTGPPWNWNIPDFVEIDVEARSLATTRASGENRTTPIRHLERDGEHIYLQGVQEGRAFSIVIDEDTGDLTFAVATPGVALVAFGGCTPRVATK
jgi:hypothetical protein